MKRQLFVLLMLFAAIAGAVGAAVSIAMVIRAVQWSEWGRVVLYSVTTAICVEMAVLSISKLKNKETA